jgi:hypothetical protein
MKSFYPSLVFALTLGGVFAVTNGGACGGESASSPPHDLAGLAGDMYRPSADMGSSADFGSLVEAATLTSPAPLSSKVALSTNFMFDIVLVGSQQQDVQSLIDIRPRGASTPLGGAFSWKGSGVGLHKLTFLPTAPLVDKTDYVITVGDPKQPGVDLLKTGITAGSRPRVTTVTLHGESHGSTVYFLWTFSEPMKTLTVDPRVKVTAGGVDVPGIVSLTGNLNEFRFTFTDGKGLADPVTLQLAPGVQAMTNELLEADGWDAMTKLPDGTFEVSFGSVDVETPLSVTYTWAPVID